MQYWLAVIIQNLNAVMAVVVRVGVMVSQRKLNVDTMLCESALLLPGFKA